MKITEEKISTLYAKSYEIGFQQNFGKKITDFGVRIVSIWVCVCVWGGGGGEVARYINIKTQVGIIFNSLQLLV